MDLLALAPLYLGGSGPCLALSSRHWRFASFVSSRRFGPLGSSAADRRSGSSLPRDIPVDLELAWHGVWQLGSLPQEVCGRLGEAGLEVSLIQCEFASRSLVVTETQQICTLMLRAEPGPSLESPWQSLLGGITIEVESPHDLLVGRLCSLLNGPDLRDLADVRTLMESGGVTLRRALEDAPRRCQEFLPSCWRGVYKRFRFQEQIWMARTSRC